MSEQSGFEWVGGAPCLDFHNTVTWAGEGMVNERLASYQDLVAWGREAGLLSQGAAERLARAAREQPEAAERSLRQAHQLRDLLHEVLIAAAAGRRPEARALAAFNDRLTGALTRLRAEPAGAGWTWSWEPAERDLSQVLGPVVWSAAQLLTGEDRTWLKTCVSDECGWVFLDRSRNHARRWCDMKSCGNSEKARRHYHRVRSRRGP